MESSDEEIVCDFGGIPLAQSTPKSYVQLQRPIDAKQSTDSAYFHPAFISIDLSETSINFSVAEPSLAQKFKAPSAPPSNKKWKPTLTCPHCSKGYLCQRSFRNHVRNHIIQDAAARFPDGEEIMRHSAEIAQEALRKTFQMKTAEVVRQPMTYLLDEVATISKNEEWLQFCNAVCGHLIEQVVLKRCLLPSALLTSLMASVSALMSDNNCCHALLNILPISQDISEDLKSQFLLEFTLNFASSTLSFISETFRSSSRLIPSKALPQVDEDDHEVIYYIGGSIIRGYLKIAERNKTSPTWNLIANALKSKVLCDTPSQQQYAAWTRSIDRGGLLYPTENFQKFLLGVTQVVFRSENADGSINYESVIKTVSESDITVTWDETIFDSLPENLSVSLMNDIIKYLCKTCGRGFAKRRINAFRERPVISMPTRHAVASRRRK